MDKITIVKFIVKVLLYALGLVATYLGITSLSSCTSSRNVEVTGRSTILIQDTTYVTHGSNYYRNFKYRY